jgi:diguanylate cyclase (GGDEF)-like protein
MISAAIPIGETARLKALDAAGILATPDEHSFNCVTNIGARLFDVPVCLLSLVDANRQWFKSVVGLGIKESPRDVAICAHVVGTGGPVIVEDTLCDARFADNPLVSASPRLRFYAGCPVRATSGEILGALCLLDYEPRHFPERQVALLRELASLAEVSLLTRRVSAAQRALTAKLEAARRACLIDPWLRIWNRGGINSILEHQRQISIDSGSPFSTLMIDIDHFKRVNDSHGHLIGDRLLGAVVRSLQSALRAGDELGRYGGEEFLVVLPDTSASGAKSLALRMADAVGIVRVDVPTGIIGCGVTIGCTVSIGAAEWRGNAGESLYSLLSRTDHALLQAKSRGRNCVQVSDFVANRDTGSITC